jgi:phosphomethylpyrimidine synthase
MKITQDVRKYAEDHQVTDESAIEKGMEEMSETFKSRGSEIYF